MSSTKTVFDLFKLNISRTPVMYKTLCYTLQEKKKKKRKLSLEKSKGKNKLCTNCNKDESFGLGAELEQELDSSILWVILHFPVCVIMGTYVKDNISQLQRKQTSTVSAP